MYIGQLRKLRGRFHNRNNGRRLVSWRTRIWIQIYLTSHKHTPIPWSEQSKLQLFLYFTFQCLICSMFFYSSQFISICVILCKIYIYFLMRKSHLIKSIFKNIFVILILTIVLQQICWISLSLWILDDCTTNSENIVSDFNIWCHFYISVYHDPIPLSFCIDRNVAMHMYVNIDRCMFFWKFTNI